MLATRQNVLSIDSLTATTLVFVNIDDCYYDASLKTAVLKKKSATAVLNDEEGTNDPWITAVVVNVEKSSGTIVVQCDKTDNAEFSNKELRCTVEQLSLKNPTQIEAVDDITTLSYLHEAALLNNLSLRYDRDMIYTYVGPILIAVNPYKRLSDSMYGSQTIDAYVGQPMGKLSPHTYAVAEDAFRSMLNDAKNQSILVTGESGAGKTETTKYLLRYFAAMGKKAHGSQLTPGGTSGSRQTTSIENQVLSSTPMLEAFGNAKTLRNDNSSRFGKFIEIQFNKVYGSIEGALIRTYLLEKSRLTRQTKGERNYHIFYQMLAGITSEQRTKWFLDDNGVSKNATDFAYLVQGECVEVEDVSDAEQYAITKQAMTIVGITETEQEETMRILCGILFLGNVKFEKLDGNDDGCRIADDGVSANNLKIACELIGINQNAIATTFLQRRITVGRESYDVKLTMEQAENARDSLAMLLYSRLFDWLVLRMNEQMSAVSMSKIASMPSKTLLTIGILDIYGFESFQTNSLEQFCINWSNEKLQQQYNQHIFKLSQQDYIREQIEWTNIEFNDNQGCLDLIEKLPLSIINLLDEECKFPKSNEKTLAEKLYKNYMPPTSQPNNPALQFAASYFAKPRFGNTSFTINHYADPVTYDCQTFLDKNRDYVIPDQILALEKSEFTLVRDRLFKKVGIQSSPSKSQQNFQFSSVTSQFKESLSQLMDNINSTYPHYIRCIKPNSFKKPGIFAKKQVLKQLKNGGILESIRITLEGYPTKKLYAEFRERYKLVAASAAGNLKLSDREACQVMLDKMQISKDAYQFGQTKLFLRSGQIEMIEKLRTATLNDSATFIAKHFRRYIKQKWYAKLKKAVLAAQTYCRGEAARIQLHKMKKDRDATKIQSISRGYLERTKFRKARMDIIKLQRLAKTTLAYKKWKNLVEMQTAAVAIQALARGIAARETYAELLREAKSLAAVQKQKEEMEKQLLEMKIRMEEENRKREAEMEETRRILEEEARRKEEEERERLRQIREAEEREEALRIEREQQENALVSLESEVERLRQENATLRSKLREEQREKQRIEAEQRQQRADAERVKQQLEIELQQARMQLEAEKSLLKLKTEELQHQLSAEIKVKAQFEKEQDRKMRDYEQKIVENEKEKTKNAKKLKKLEDSVEGAKEQTESMKAQFVKEMKIKAKLKETNKKLEKDMDALWDDMDKLKEDQLNQLEMLSEEREKQRQEYAVEKERADTLQQRLDIIEQERKILRKSKEEELVFDLERCLKKMQGDMQESAERFVVHLIFESKQHDFANNTVAIPAFLIYHVVTRWIKTKRDYERLTTLAINSLRAIITLNVENRRSLAYWFSNLAVLLDLFTSPDYLSSIMNAIANPDRGTGDPNGLLTEINGYLTDIRHYSMEDIIIFELDDITSVSSPTEPPSHKLQHDHPYLIWVKNLTALFIKVMVSILRDCMDRLAPLLKGSVLEGPLITDPSTGELVSSTTNVVKLLRDIYDTLDENRVGKSTTKYIFEQLIGFIDSALFNEILLRKDLCSFSKGIEIKLNVSMIDAEVSIWLGSDVSLERVRQAVTLLMTSKNNITNPEIRQQTVPLLTVAQIHKILSMYTRTEFEDPIPNEIFSLLSAQQKSASDRTLFLTARRVSPISSLSNVLRNAFVQGQLHFLSFPTSIKDDIDSKWTEEQKIKEKEQREQQAQQLDTPQLSARAKRKSFFGFQYQ